jgi:hypothetical protein
LKKKKIKKFNKKKFIDRNWTINTCHLRVSNPNYQCQSVTQKRELLKNKKKLKSNKCGVMWSELVWFMWIDFCFMLSEVKWVTVKFLGTTVACTLGWPYTEGTWLYCDFFKFMVPCILILYI